MWKDEGDVRERVLRMFTELSIEWTETKKGVARYRQGNRQANANRNVVKKKRNASKHSEHPPGRAGK